MVATLVALLLALCLPYIGLMCISWIGQFRVVPHARTDRTPSVSVIVPAHDEEDDIAGTLASLSSQEYRGAAEIVVVDDRSTDGTSRLIREAAARDPRIRLVRIDHAHPTMAPKVHAVRRGIESSSGEIVVTTDADCRYPKGWLEGMVSHFTDDVTMVVGYVDCTRRGEATTWLRRFETLDMMSLMVTSQALTTFGLAMASSANNQAYRRSAFEAAGGFGAIGRAPSGDEDLLMQRLGRLPGARIVFADAPEVRVTTSSMATWRDLFKQRRRWVSRYHHAVHYKPAFLASIAVLGAQSIVLSLAALATPFLDGLLPWVAAVWGAKLAVEISGMWIASVRFQRPDLAGVPVVFWAVLHPFFIGSVVIGSFVKPGAWYAGARSYRRTWLQRRARIARRTVRDWLEPRRITGRDGSSNA